VRPHALAVLGCARTAYSAGDSHSAVTHIAGRRRSRLEHVDGLHENSRTGSIVLGRGREVLLGAAAAVHHHISSTESAR
jgi:hypothetical protein